jgi:hypothetical protein
MRARVLALAPVAIAWAWAPFVRQPVELLLLLVLGACPLLAHPGPVLALYSFQLLLVLALLCITVPASGTYDSVRIARVIVWTVACAGVHVWLYIRERRSREGILVKAEASATRRATVALQLEQRRLSLAASRRSILEQSSVSTGLLNDSLRLSSAAAMHAAAPGPLPHLLGADVQAASRM